MVSSGIHILQFAHRYSDIYMNIRAGEWHPSEHQLFLECLRMFPSGSRKRWKTISQIIKTRTATQIRTHAQKYYQKLQRYKKNSPKPLQRSLSFDSCSEISVEQQFTTSEIEFLNSILDC